VFMVFKFLFGSNIYWDKNHYINLLKKNRKMIIFFNMYLIFRFL